MISQTAEYALRAMVYLAIRGTGATGEQVAATTKVPRGYLPKILKQLSRAKLLNSQRGVGGGFVLSRKADDISILDVVNAVDPIERITKCPLSIGAHSLNLCPLHQRIADATACVETAFAETRLSELVAESASPQCKSVPLQGGETNCHGLVDQ